VAATALTKAYENKRILPVVNFDKDGDIVLQQSIEDFEKYGDVNDVEKSGAKYNPKTFNILNKRRGVVIELDDDKSVQNSELSLELNDTLKNIRAMIKRMLFSQVGVGCLVVLYVVLGGLMFDAIESSNEKEVKARQKGNRDQLIERLRSGAEGIFNNYLNKSFELKYSHWRDYMRRSTRLEMGWKVELDNNLWNDLVLKELALYEHRELETGYKDTKDQEERQTEIWTITSAMLYSATVITTIGYGNITPKTTQGKILTMIYALFGIPLMFICLTNTGDVLANIFINSYSKAVNSFCLTCCNKRLRKIAGYSSGDLSEINDDLDGNFHHHQHQDKKHVPILATLGALAIYIFSGAILFGAWEEWHVIDGAYFCFITFTTIGFGDFVPGQGIMSRNKSGKMMLCSIFLLVGMIVMAMCFKLMQDELVSKIRAIGRKLGIID
ncbi:hypothetical protein GJ496_004854, partial [Pomphorhynchus laevis]